MRKGEEVAGGRQETVQLVIVWSVPLPLVYLVLIIFRDGNNPRTHFWFLRNKSMRAEESDVNRPYEISIFGGRYGSFSFLTVWSPFIGLISIPRVNNKREPFTCGWIPSFRHHLLFRPQKQGFQLQFIVCDSQETVSRWNRKWANQSCWVKCFFFLYCFFFFFFFFFLFSYTTVKGLLLLLILPADTASHVMFHWGQTTTKDPSKFFFFFYKVMMRGVQIVPWCTGHQKCRGNGFWTLFFLRSLAVMGLVFM